MKFVVDRDELVRAVVVTAWSDTTPLYAAVGSAGVALIGDDGGTRVSTKVTCTVDGDDDARVQRLPAAKFPAACRHLPKGEVTVAVTDTAWVLTVDGVTTVTVPARSPDGLAVLGELPAVGTIGKDFVNAVKRVRAAAAQFPPLAVVRLEAAGERLRLVATDRYRLHAAEVRCDDLTLEGTPLLPLRAAVATGALSAGTPVEFHADESQVEFTDGTTTVRSRLSIEGFPDYAPLLRIEPVTAAFVSPVKLRAAVTDAARILGEDDRCYLTFRPESALVDVEATASSSDMQFRTSVEADGIDGIETTVGVAPRRVVAALQAARANQVEIDLHGEFDRIIFRNPRARVPFAVVMPVR